MMYQWGTTTLSIPDQVEADPAGQAGYLGGLRLEQILRIVQENFSDIDHDHDGDYAAAGHDHDGDYLRTDGDGTIEDAGDNTILHLKPGSGNKYTALMLGEATQNTQYIIAYGPSYSTANPTSSYPYRLALKTNHADGTVAIHTGVQALAILVDASQIAMFMNTPTVQGEDIYHEGNLTINEVPAVNQINHRTMKIDINASTGANIDIPTNCGGQITILEDGANHQAFGLFNNEGGTLDYQELRDTGGHVSMSGNSIRIYNNHGGVASYYVYIAGRNLSGITVTPD